MNNLGKHIRHLLLISIMLMGGAVSAQFILQAPGSTDEHNYRWYEANDPLTVLGTDSSYEVYVPGVYFATYDGTRCGKNATSYFIVTYCGDPDDQVTLDISNSVPTGATVSWSPVVPGDQLRPTVTAQYGQDNIVTYAPTVTLLGNTFRLPTFKVICLQGPFTLVDDVVSTDENVALDIDMLDNDANIPGVGVISITQPVNGTAVLNTNGTPSDPSDDTVTYTPDTNFTGTDTFTYELTLINSDGTVMTQEATITVNVIDVDDEPVAENDMLTVLEDSQSGPDNQIDVSQNDYIGNDGGDGNDYALVTPPNNGTVTEISDGVFEYIPNPDFNGMDSFVYSITDKDGSQTTATVQVTVTPVNDPPIAMDDEYITAQNTPLTANVLENDIDVDGDALTITSVTQPVFGNVVINDDNTITYTPPAGFTGTVTFNYYITDGNGQEDVATVTIQVVASDVTIAVDDDLTTAEDTSVTFAILDNDQITSGMTVVITEVEAPINGTITLNADNTLTYVPEPDYVGVNYFDYTISVTMSDGSVVYDSARITIEVTPVQDVMNDSATVNSNNPVEIIISVFDNDTFDPNTNVYIVSMSTPINGTATLNPDGTITYIVNEGFEGMDVFTYTVTVVSSDGSTNNETGSIAITAVAGEPKDPPPPPVEEEVLLVHQLMTPNGDGRNDVLQIDGLELFPENTVRIFNRWGVMVYETQGYGTSGNYFTGVSEGRMTISKDSKLPSGTYYYAIEYSDGGIQKSKAGYFYINN